MWFSQKFPKLKMKPFELENHTKIVFKTFLLAYFDEKFPLSSREILKTKKIFTFFYKITYKYFLIKLFAKIFWFLVKLSSFILDLRHENLRKKSTKKILTLLIKKNKNKNSIAFFTCIPVHSGVAQEIGNHSKHATDQYSV